jgi:hypothetical protein
MTRKMLKAKGKGHYIKTNFVIYSGYVVLPGYEVWENVFSWIYGPNGRNKESIQNFDGKPPKKRSLGRLRRGRGVSLRVLLP